MSWLNALGGAGRVLGYEADATRKRQQDELAAAQAQQQMQVFKQKQDEYAQQQAAQKIYGSTILDAMSGSGIPGASPMPPGIQPPQAPQQGGGSPIQMLPPGIGVAPSPSPGQPSMPMQGGPRQPMQQAPQQPMQPPQAVPQAGLTWQAIAQKIKQQAPNAPPEVIAQVVDRYIPLMDAQNKASWEQTKEAYRIKHETAQEDIANKRYDESVRKDDLRHSEYLASMNQRAATSEAGKWQIMQTTGEDGKPKSVRINTATGEVAPLDVGPLSKPGASKTAGGAVLDPETKHSMAEQYLAGDHTVLQNLGRGAQGAENIVALRQEITKIAKEKGMSPEQINTARAEFSGVVAEEGALGRRAAAIGTAAAEAEETMPILRETSKAFGRTSLPDVNAALAAYETKTGDTKVVAYGAALNAYINAYARAISPTGTPTVSDKEHAREVFSKVSSEDQLNAVLDIADREIQAALRSPGKVRQSIRDERGGTQSSDGPKQLPSGWSVEVH